MGACTEMSNDAYKRSDFAQKFLNVNSFVSLSCERLSELDASGVDCVSYIWTLFRLKRDDFGHFCPGLAPCVFR